MERILHNKKTYNTVVKINLISISIALMYFFFLWKYVGDWLMNILWIYIPSIMILIFAFYLIFRVNIKTSLFFLIINSIILYLTIDYISKALVM